MIVQINYNNNEDGLSESYAEIACNGKGHGNTEHDHASYSVYNPLGVKKHKCKDKFKYESNECAPVSLPHNKQINAVYEEPSWSAKVEQPWHFKRPCLQYHKHD